MEGGDEGGGRREVAAPGQGHVPLHGTGATDGKGRGEWFVFNLSLVGVVWRGQTSLMEPGLCWHVCDRLRLVCMQL